jgi:hypothetical protein
MVQRVTTAAFEGIEVRPVDVQVQIAPGMPAFTIVDCQCPRRNGSPFSPWPLPFISAAISKIATKDRTLEEAVFQRGLTSL